MTPLCVDFLTLDVLSVIHFFSTRIKLIFLFFLSNTAYRRLLILHCQTCSYPHYLQWYKKTLKQSQFNNMFGLSNSKIIIVIKKNTLTFSILLVAFSFPLEFCRPVKWLLKARQAQITGPGTLTSLVLW